MMDVRPDEGKTIDDILASIMEGRTDQPEIFETLKSVAAASPSPPSASQERKEPLVAPFLEPEKQFLCPVCDTVVRPEDRVCPGCGAEFSEGEAMEYECPVCRASVSADADRCPSCGVQFAMEETPEPTVEAGGAEAAHGTATTQPEPTGPSSAAVPATRGTLTGAKPPTGLYASLQQRLISLRERRQTDRPELPEGDRKLMARELPRLVNDVKPLLVSAKRIGLDIEMGKRQINEAIQAGKRREIETAVRLIAEARRSLDLAFVDFLGNRVKTLAEEVGQSPSHPSMEEVETLLEESLAAMEKKDYDTAWDKIEEATQTFQAQTKEYHEAREVIKESQGLLSGAREMGMDVQACERLIQQGQQALERRDFSGGLKLARQARERLLQEVPGFVHEEMRKARNTLLDFKMRGKDVSRSVGILKEASVQVKEGRWTEAVRFLREFHKEIGRLGKV